ncbi:MAG: hypothetical protein Q8L55_10045 [Phycisphaerales bacterium]|nr:hypothetical protein [Phycisphaerales bacterium]
MSNTCRAVSLLTAATLLATVVHGQVAEQNWPASTLNVDVGAPNNTGWGGWSLGGLGYGWGANNQGASGYISHGYDFASNLTAIHVDLNELRNTGGPFIATNSPYIRTTGQVLFTPLTSMAYTITGVVAVSLTGASTSNTTATGGLVLEVVSGPTLATYTGGVFRSGAGGFGAAGNIFDAGLPASGSSTGFLSSGTTYRLSWDFIMSSNMNNDSTLSADVSTAPGGSFFEIAFAIPTPGAAALLGLGTLAAAGRRRA